LKAGDREQGILRGKKWKLLFENNLI
jgi:hypothetical protein